MLRIFIFLFIAISAIVIAPWGRAGGNSSGAQISNPQNTFCEVRRARNGSGHWIQITATPQSAATAHNGSKIQVQVGIMTLSGNYNRTFIGQNNWHKYE